MIQEEHMYIASKGSVLKLDFTSVAICMGNIKCVLIAHNKMSEIPYKVILKY